MLISVMREWEVLDVSPESATGVAGGGREPERFCMRLSDLPLYFSLQKNDRVARLLRSAAGKTEAGVSICRRSRVRQRTAGTSARKRLQIKPVLNDGNIERLVVGEQVGDRFTADRLRSALIRLLLGGFSGCAVGA